MSLITSGLQAAGLDEGAEEDYRAAFGDGTDYDWALALQEQQDYEEQGEGRELELKDVFEPAQLKERMLTDEDNEIRENDVPERIQLARKPFKQLELTDEAMSERLDEEAQWITALLWPKKSLPSYFNSPFRKAVRRVLEFMNLEDYEVPFIFNHRKDYLIHAPSEEQDDMDADMPPLDAKAERLLNQSDLWVVFDLDLKFRAFSEKREALRMTYDGLKAISPTIQDDVVEELIDKSSSIEEVQELQDYLQFQYSAEIKDLRLLEAEQNKTQKRANNARNYVERIRGTDVYKFVLGLGIKADEVAKNAEANRRPFYEDPEKSPMEFAEDQTGPPPFETADEVVKAAKTAYISELVNSPRLRKYVRSQFYPRGLIDCIRTDAGLRKITEDHPYYEFKYLRGQSFFDLSGRPELFLKMLKAEEEGLIQIRIRMDKYEEFKRKMHGYIENDKVSDLAQAWNKLRREMLDSALDKMTTHIATGMKEQLRARCEDDLAARARDNYVNKLDQAPFKANHMDHGVVPNVLAISNGKGQRGDATCWAYVENDGRVRESGKLVDFRLGNPDRNIPDGADVERFVEVLRRRKPDVIGVSGFSVETRRLYKELQEIINKYDIRGPSYDDDDIEKSDPLEVTMVNDEVARLYYMSPRAEEEFPKLPYVTRYCVALARYLQNPLAEYASLGKDVVSIPFVPDQVLISQEKLLDRLENAMVDMVNLVGINLRDAYEDPYLAKLLPYVCGLGPRKADRLLKAIQANGDEVISRFDLLGITLENDDRTLKAAMGPKVFQNAASFLYLEFDNHTDDSDYLDNTRVHPEDYDLARKMVADAMNMDEEDIKAEVDEGGPSAVVRRMVRDEQTDLIQDLILEDYASEIEKKLGHRKRATLETIRAELVEPYEEIRQPFCMVSSDEIFTMLTGETKETLAEGMVIPVQIKRTFSDHIEVRLECGIEGSVSDTEFPDGVGGGGQEPRAVFQPHQTVRARVMFLNRKLLNAQLSLRQDMINKPGLRAVDRVSGEWDYAQEEADKKAAERAKEVATGRPNRVVNHPLFYQMNSLQAEEYLGSKEPGEVVIRPSSKGLDHLAVTWKVTDNSYQHIDVLELGKTTEYSLGKQLKIGKYLYSDLDELIVNHVEAMAKKVTELTKDDRFQKNGLEACRKFALFSLFFHFLLCDFFY